VHPAGASLGDDVDTPGSLPAFTPAAPAREDGAASGPSTLPTVTLMADRSIAQIVELVQTENDTVWLAAILKRLLYGGDDVGDPRMAEKKVRVVFTTRMGVLVAVWSLGSHSPSPACPFAD
jgi:hypothetical protein